MRYTSSVWKGTVQEAAFPQLRGDVEVDVAVVGGGITGVTAAMLLSKGGKSVALVEAGRIGHGTSGDSTGNLHAMLDNGLYQIREQWDDDTMNLIAAHRARTMDAIERTVVEFDLKCGFRRCPHIIYPVGEASLDRLENEYLAATDAALQAFMTDEVPLPFHTGRSLKIMNQAQFHPLAYVRSLAANIQAERCRLFELSPATAIDDYHQAVETATGRIRARHIILATHTPKGFNPVQTGLGPYREYGIATVLQDQSYPQGIFWSMDEPSFSVRSVEWHGRRYLIVIGERHKTGQHRDTADYFARVEHFAATHFKPAAIMYRWSAQHYHPADGLPYIGRSPLADNTYIATGFGTNGLVYGPLAAAMITDQILGREHPLHDLLKPSRFTPIKSAKDFLKENLNVAKQYVRDYLAAADMVALDEIRREEGRIVEVNGRDLAVSRDEAGTLTVLSPTCTHLGCKVHWNRWEQSWDCPCHGSRFNGDGSILEGPALAPLERKELPEQKQR